MKSYQVTYAQYVIFLAHRRRRMHTIPLHWFRILFISSSSIQRTQKQIKVSSRFIQSHNFSMRTQRNKKHADKERRRRETEKSKYTINDNGLDNVLFCFFLFHFGIDKIILILRYDVRVAGVRNE